MTSYQDDFAYCRSIIKHHSKSFYLAFSRLPSAKANAVFAVYAFCRLADDCVDVHKDSMGLERLHMQLLDFSNGHVPDEPMWRALGVVFSTFAMSTEPFFAMLEGQELDLRFKQPQTTADLDHYCYLVAGTVGEMLLPILATRNAHLLREDANKLGMAMQITNILRDVGQDLDLGRVYLPASVMEQHGYSLKDLQQKILDQRFIAVWEHEAQRAEAYYNTAEQSFHLYDSDCLAPLIMSAQLYRQILNVVRKNNYNCLTVRNHVGALGKAAVLWKAYSQVPKLHRRGIV